MSAVERASGGKHARDEFREIAERGTILRCQVGSGVHGTAIAGQDDRDEMGICIEPPEYVIGLRRFEQYIYRTQPEGSRSGPGDLDLTVYCHDPASRVLTADLHWEPIGDLRPGRELVTFDEGPASRDRHRHFSTGQVAATQARIMDRCRVVTSAGETVVTPGHGFLVRRVSKPRTRWVPASQLQPGDQVYALPTWDTDTSWEAGYLAGQFDGDGYLSLYDVAGGWSVSQLGWTQKAGRPDVAYLEQVLASRGFKWRTDGANTSGCATVHVGRDWSEHLRFLGSIRPPRLLSHPQLHRLWEARSLKVCQRATVQAVIPLVAGPMVAMETSTHTYIADGLLTHNSLRKWMRLALAGNPTILLPLFVPEAEIVTSTELGEELRESAGLIISRQAGKRFAGYLEAQRRSLLSRDGKGRDVTRPELVAKYGWDVKFGAHMVRLGVQGVELLETGRVTLPMPEPWLSEIRSLRTGGHSMRWALAEAERLEKRLLELCESSPLREKPDHEWADYWLIRAYQTAWAKAG